ncbi:MAG: hypothetical protein JHC33_02290, partial [Ignisphaera sp.]|nr:hypothetical protein [Ignisphaera sp.]
MSLKEGIGLKNFGMAFSLILLTLSVVNAADMDTPYNAGISASDQTKGVLTSGQKDKLYAPLTSDAPMTTLDGSKSGKVKFGCKDATTFRLDFYFVPKGNNTYGLIVKKGDGTLLLNTDSVVYQNYAGSRVTYTGIAISGVCDNGIVYCKGAWNDQNCYYFKYVADSKGNLSLSQVWLQDSSSRDLGQCSCTDASCGWANIVPYSYVVGSIANALMSANSKYQMSSGSWDSSQFKYTYYGMDNSNCTSASGNPYSPGDDNPSRFYSPNGGDIDRGTIDSVTAQQSFNNNSPYSIATKLQSVQYSKNGTTVQVSKPNFPYCFVSNDIGVQQEIVNPIVGGCKLKSTHLYWPYYYSGACSFNIACNSDGTYCHGDQQGCDGCGEWITVTVDGTKINVWGTTRGEGCDWDDFRSVTLDQCGSVIVPLPGVSTNAYIDTEPIYTCPSGYTMVGSSCKRDKAVLVSNDGCASYENNSECHVYNKWICNRG